MLRDQITNTKVGGGGGYAQFDFSEIKIKQVSLTGCKNQQKIKMSF